jgi:hypothetical protein
MVKQVISTRKLRRNSLHWYSIATPEDILEGVQWYADAMAYAQFLSIEFNISKVTAAAVISALSPNNKWERNKVDAFNVIQAWRDGLTPDHVKCCTYNANKFKAFFILQGNAEILRKSRKTHAFALNVGANDESVVTIDKWMLRAFATTSKTPKQCRESVTAQQYDVLAKQFCKVARDTGYKPYELQAIIWVVIRKHWL